MADQNYIRVDDLDEFTRFITALGNPPTGLKTEYLHRVSLAEPAEDWFKELVFLHKHVDYQSKQVALFITDVIKGYPGAGDAINYIGGNYSRAEMDGDDLLRGKMTPKQADDRIAAWMKQDDGLKHDPHSWKKGGLSNADLDTRDSYVDKKEMERFPLPAESGKTKWEKEGVGKTFYNVWEYFMKLEPSRLADRAQDWQAQADALKAAERDLRRPTNNLQKVWDGPASKAFYGRMEESLSSIDYWALSIEVRAASLKATADTIGWYWRLINKFKPGYDELMAKYKPQFEPGPANSLGLVASDPSAAESVIKTYDEFASDIGSLLGQFLTQVATAWQAPPRFPGFISDKPLPVATRPATGPTGPGAAPGGGGGGAAPGGGGNAQKTIDDLAARYEKVAKKQRAEYEKALKAQEAAAAKLRKQYERNLKEQRDAAAKQIAALQKALKESQAGAAEQQQQGAQDAAQAAQAAMQQQKDLLGQLGGTPPQSIADLSRSLGDAMTQAGVSPATLAALPSLLSGLGGSLPGLSGSPTGGGLGGTSGLPGLPTASGSMDLMGRGGAVPGTTTGLGTTPLSGRPVGAAAGGGSGMPFMPMGGQPMGGGGGGASGLNGRRGRPVLPGEERKKPVGRPRIVDPSGDGSTEAYPGRDGDRRATVARPGKAPEAEPGQALGRTA